MENCGEKRMWLIMARVGEGKSQREVAKECGISAPTYGEYEAGTLTPKVENARKVAKVLGFDWNKFYEESPDAV